MTPRYPQPATPFDLRPGTRVRQTRVPAYLEATRQGRHFARLLGRTGTIEFVTDNKAAWIIWDDGDQGTVSADCLELVK